MYILFLLPCPGVVVCFVGLVACAAVNSARGVVFGCTGSTGATGATGAGAGGGVSGVTSFSGDWVE